MVVYVDIEEMGTIQVLTCIEANLLTQEVVLSFLNGFQLRRVEYREQGLYDVVGKIQVLIRDFLYYLDQVVLTDSCLRKQ